MRRTPAAVGIAKVAPVQYPRRYTVRTGAEEHSAAPHSSVS